MEGKWCVYQPIRLKCFTTQPKMWAAHYWTKTGSCNGICSCNFSFRDLKSSISLITQVFPWNFLNRDHANELIYV